MSDELINELRQQLNKEVDIFGTKDCSYQKFYKIRIGNNFYQKEFLEECINDLEKLFSITQSTNDMRSLTMLLRKVLRDEFTI